MMRKLLHSFRLVSVISLLILGSMFFLQPESVQGEKYDVAPAQISDVRVEISNSIRLAWAEGDEWDLFSYVIHLRSSTEKEAGSVFLTGLSDEYVFTDLEPGQYYFVQVQARDNAGNLGELSREVGFYVPEVGENSDFSLHGWVPASADLADGIDSFRTHQSLFSSVSPFEYALTVDGGVARQASVFNLEDREFIQDGGTQIIPSITNNFDIDNIGSEVIGDADRRSRHVEEIVNLVLSENYDGIDIDYENIKPEFKDDFTAFVSALSQELHAHDRLLHVTLQPKRSDDQNWRGVGAQDFAAIGRHADFVRVMSYDHSRENTLPGSIAPIDWYKEVLVYAASLIDVEKLVAGIPTYGYRWCVKEVEGESCENDGLVYAGVQKLLLQYDVEPSFSSETLTPYFSYTDDVGRDFIVHYENEQSIRAKLKLISRLGLSGASLWRLGNEDPQIYETLASEYISKQSRLEQISALPGDEEILFSFGSDVSRDGYRISYRSQGGQSQEVEVFNDTSYVLKNLENDVTYEISVEPIELSVSLEGDDVVLNSENEIDSYSFTLIPGDSTDPFAVEDLLVSEIGTSTAQLTFSATGDDAMDGAASAYDIRFSDKEITAENFDHAQKISYAKDPAEPFAQEVVDIDGLIGGKQYWVAMKVVDEAGNNSFISNVVSFRTVDHEAPSKPIISEVVARDGEAEIIWNSAPEDDVAGYYVYLLTPDEGELPLSIGKEKNHILIPYLKNNAIYQLSLSVFDESGNESERSEIVEIIPRSNDPIVRFSDEILLSHEKLKGSLSSFGAELFSEKNTPYMALFAVIVINLFLYLSFKSEMVRLLRLRIQGESAASVDSELSMHGTIKVRDVGHKKIR